jgi:AcrR family transcriptional regulator
MTSSGTMDRPRSRRELYKQQTRMALAVAAYTLATERGLAAVKVPEVAAAAGVSTRTFNNYFASKEQAIVWPSGRHLTEMADILRGRPAEESLADALIAAVTGVYQPPAEHGLPPHFVRGFRALVATEPALYAEFLRVSQVAEQELARAIAERENGRLDPFAAAVVAGMTLGAERAAVRHWMAAGQRTGRLVDTVSQGLRLALGRRAELLL